MSTSPLVSVCMPVFNAQDYLVEALDSVLSQTYENIELICVDDGSTDSSLEILKQYADRVSIIESSNQGAPHARNLAFSASKGEFIQFFDADNILDSDKILRQLKIIQDTNSDLVFCNKRVITGNGPAKDLSHLPTPEGMDPFLYCLRFNLPGGRAAIDTDVPLHRRLILERIGGFRLGVTRGQDKDLALRLAAAGAKFQYLDEVLVTYRDHDGPRISHRAKSPRFHVDYFISLIEVLSDDALYHLTSERRHELAVVLSRFSKTAYREGDRDGARFGFSFASNLCEYSDPLEGKFYSLLQRSFGYELTERLRQLAHR